MEKILDDMANQIVTWMQWSFLAGIAVGMVAGYVLRFAFEKDSKLTRAPEARN